jgi:hydrogenase nickel incorporation protein HypA/HybF
MREGTLLSETELVIRHVPGYLHCNDCQKDFVKQKSQLDCPQCGKQGVPTEKGKEFYIEKVA